MNAATRDDAQSIIVEYDLAHPPARVWRALTDAKLVASWLMPNDLRPVVGHRFTFQAAPIPGVWDGVCHCEVLEVKPNERLSYSWRGGSENVENYGQRLDTIVTWTLAPSGSGTLLRLVHSGFKPANAHAFEIMGKGWRGKVAERIAEVIASAPA